VHENRCNIGFADGHVAATLRISGQLIHELEADAKAFLPYNF
jgi:prepilin-type processing-associated H-X9-DG protein